MRDLDKKLASWTKTGLIAEEQARAIAAHEAAEGRRGIPVIAEALGYLGGTLVIAAVVSVFGQSWGDLGVGSRLAITVIATGLLAVGGWAFRDSEEAALQRTASLLMFLSVAAAALFFTVLTEGRDLGDGAWAMAIGFGTAAYALPLWFLHRKALQQLAMFSGIFVGLLGASDSQLEGGASTGVTLLLAGLVWIAGTAGRHVLPVTTGFVIGALTTVIGGQILFFQWQGVGLLLGLVTSVGLVVWSLSLRSTALLAIGFAAIFLLVTEGIFDYLGDTYGATVGLFFAGVAFVLIALITARLKPLVTRGPAP